MFTIEFYEDRNGKNDLSDYLHMLHAADREDFYKLAAFLDYLTENGSAADRTVGRYPEGTIYMHCIQGMGENCGERSAGSRHDRAGPFRRRKRFCPGKKGSSVKAAVCVILYGQYREQTGGGNTFVILHHFFTDRIPGGLPLRHLYRAVSRLQRYRRRRSPE